MSPALFPLVEKFPRCTRAERDLLLDFARTTPLRYGAWKPFKKLFKKAGAEVQSENADLELLGALLSRIDGATFVRASTRWKAVTTPLTAKKTHSVSGGGFTYKVGPRNAWYDYSGWRLIVEPEKEKASVGIVSDIRRALGLQEAAQGAPGSSGKTAPSLAFDFDAREYIYEVKSVSLNGGELRIVCGPNWGGANAREKTFVVDVSDPAFIHLREDGPKPPTLQYMKRRARRTLRHASTRTPELYLQLALQLLREHGDTPLDPALNWALMDVLFANSPCWKQPQPGRGPYKKIAGQFVRKRREERAPEVWDAHPEIARELLSRRDVPIEANETAFKILRAHNQVDARVLDAAQLQRFLACDAPLLQSLATRLLTRAWQQNPSLDGATWARLALLSNARNRRLLVAQPLPADAAWNSQAAQTLSAALEARAAPAKRRAAHLLAARFANFVDDETLWRHLETFANAGEYSRAWTLDRVRESARNGEFSRLTQIAALPPDVRETMMRAFREGAANAEPTIEQALPLVAGNDQSLNEIGWQLLAATTLSPEVARELWRRVWSSSAFFAPQVWTTAAQSDGAFQVFQRAGFSSETVADVLEIESAQEKASAFFDALPPAFFAVVFRFFLPSTQVERALSANDEQWKAAREALLQTLGNPDLLGTFWARVLALVAQGADESLQRRILGDEAISATFERVGSQAITELLQGTQAAQVPFALRWLDTNLSQTKRGDAVLLAAATHPIGEIRARGLTRISELGLDLPLALRLMESGLPQPFEMAKTWFGTNENLDPADRALALCDSPDARVRAYGRDFLEENAARVLDANILRRLSENADPLMQSWLAEHLLEGAQGAEVATFDRAVLRSRGRARRAKEAVKKRRASAAAPREYSQGDLAALLDVARGVTTRDREWALRQLAQIALSGQEIDGVQLSKPAHDGGKSWK